MCKFGQNLFIATLDRVQTSHFPTIKAILWPWKWGQGHQTLISSFTCPSNTDVQVWSKSIHSFKRYGADKPSSNNLSPPVTLKMGSRSPKSNQHFPPSQWYICVSLAKICLFNKETECGQEATPPPPPGSALNTICSPPPSTPPPPWWGDIILNLHDAPMPSTISTQSDLQFGRR